MDNGEAIEWFKKRKNYAAMVMMGAGEMFNLAIAALEQQERSCDTCKHRNEHFSGKRCGDCSVGYPDRYEAESNFEAYTGDRNDQQRSNRNIIRNKD